MVQDAIFDCKQQSRYLKSKVIFYDVLTEMHIGVVYSVLGSNQINPIQ